MSSIIQNPESKDTQKEDAVGPQYERKASKNVNFSSHFDLHQKKSQSPNIYKYDSQGLTCLSSKSPLKNPHLQNKQFREDTYRTYDKSPEKQRREPFTIELMAKQKQASQNFTQAYLFEAAHQQKITENEEASSNAKQEYQENTLTEQVEEQKKCKFCHQNTLSKGQTENTERDEEEEEDEDEEEGEEEDGEQNDEEKQQKKTETENGNENNENKTQSNKNKTNKNNVNELIKICKCQKRCWAHRKCLINQTVHNKHICRFCNTQATFTTVRKWSASILKSSYQTKKSEVNSIFIAFGLNILVFVGLAIFIIHQITTQDSKFNWIVSFVILSINILYGFVFFKNKFNSLCVTQIDSEIVLKDVELKKNTHPEKKNEANQINIYGANQYNNINCNLNSLTNNNVITQQEEYPTQHFEIYDQNSQALYQLAQQQQKRVIPPMMNSINSKNSYRTSQTRRSSQTQRVKNDLPYPNKQYLNNENMVIPNQQNQQMLLQLQYANYGKPLKVGKTLFNTDESEQSPNDRTHLQTFQMLSARKNSSSSQCQGHLNELTRKNSLLNIKGPALYGYNRPSQFHQNSEVPMSNYNSKQENLEIGQIDKEPDNKEMKQSVSKISSVDHDSPFTKTSSMKPDQMQQGEQTCRFGQNQGSSNNKKKQDTSSMAKDIDQFKYILQKFPMFKKQFKQNSLNGINEESHNTSSINISQNQKIMKEKDDSVTDNKNDPDLENQQPQLYIINQTSSEENRKSSEEYIQPTIISN